MHTYYLALLFKCLGKLGITQETLLRAAGLPALKLSDNISLKAAQLDALFGSALRLTDDAQFGLKFGMQISTVPSGILGYAISTSPTIGDALSILVKYHRVLLPSMNIELVQSDNHQLVTASGATLNSDLDRFYSEVLYTGIITAGFMLMVDQLEQREQQLDKPITLLLDYEVPYDIEMYQNIFGQEVFFSSPKRALCLSNECLSIPIATSNPMAQKIFSRECDRLLSRNNDTKAINEQVQRLFIESRSEFPNSAEVAATLNMSESTLRRHLSKEGWNFQELLDKVRYKLSLEYLETTQFTVSEIASLLGFSDSANFRKAFKRWSNKTPSESRQA